MKGACLERTRTRFGDDACNLLRSQRAAARARDRSRTQQSAVDPLSSLVEVMKNEKLRNQLIGQIEALRRAAPAGGDASLGAQDPAQSVASAPAAGGAAVEEGKDVDRESGLVAALIESVRELGGRLPTAALGAPVDVKIEQA